MDPNTSTGKILGVSGTERPLELTPIHFNGCRRFSCKDTEDRSVHTLVDNTNDTVDLFLKVIAGEFGRVCLMQVKKMKK